MVSSSSHLSLLDKVQFAVLGRQGCLAKTLCAASVYGACLEIVFRLQLSALCRQDTDYLHVAKSRSGEWNVMAENPLADTLDTLDSAQSVFPQNNAGVYLPSENTAAFEEVRCRLEKLMQLEN